MSVMETLALDSIPPEQWRNGGGITRTIAREGDEWRVSIAEVQKDGPYSRFEGLSRVSFVLRGAGVVLRDAEQAIDLRPREAAAYDGGKPWEATLMNGPVSALNVMSKPGRYEVNVTAVTRSMRIEPGRVAVVLTSAIGCLLQVHPDETHELNPGNAAIFRKLEAALQLTSQRNNTSNADESDLPVVVTLEPLQK